MTAIITSITEWKQEMLSSYSDMHKDIHGCRWVPSELRKPSATMEDVLEALDLLCSSFEDDTPFVYSPTMHTNRMRF